MRAVVQRVSTACVEAENWTAAIDRGLVVFVGVERGDGPDDVDYIARKIRELRVFDAAPVTDDGATAATKSFDRSIQDIGGQVLVVSQFTLAADCRKGRRPAFDDAAPPELAKPLYESVVVALREQGLTVATGQFQSMMQVSLTNDGPVTLWLER